MPNKLFLIAAAFFLSACAGGLRSGENPAVDDIQYYESLDAAPGFELIHIIEADGFSGLFRLPTYEKAIDQAKAEAGRRGGDCIIFYKAVRAAEAGGVDVTDMMTYILMGANKGESLNRWIDENTWADQVFWYFIVGKKIMVP